MPFSSPTKHTLLPHADVNDLTVKDVNVSQHSFDNLLGNERYNSQYYDQGGDAHSSIRQEVTYQPLRRLPTLYEVLNRRSKSPVDLWGFYIFMRDYQNAVDYLDFWIDCITHLRLCKDYVKGLRESLIISERHKSSSDEKHKSTSSEKAENVRESVSSSLLLEALLSEGLLDDKDNKRVSSFLQGNEYINTSDPRISSIFSPQEEEPLTSTAQPQSPFKDVYEPLSTPEKVFAGDIQRRSSNKDIFTQDRRSTRIVPEQLEKYIANVKNGNINRATLKSSSRNILNTYFQDTSPKRLNIPDRIIRKIRHDIDLQGRDDPDVFEDAKNYVYSAMELESFSHFLHHYALHNLGNRSCLVRLILGLFLLFAGFWIAYCLIFTNIKPKAIRAVLIVPFFLGVYLILTFFYRLDPLMVLFRYSDNPELAIHKNQRRKHFVKNLYEPFVVSLQKKRALWILLLTCLISAAFSVLFGLVPGHRI